MRYVRGLLVAMMTDDICTRSLVAMRTDEICTRTPCSHDGR
jgi:hypothetical protein